MAKKRGGKRRAGLTPRRRGKPGAVPGTLNIDPQALPPRIHVIAYDSNAIEERDVSSVAELPFFLAKWAVTWVNVDGLGDAGVLNQLAEQFHIHPLALEDVVNVNQRPKVETYREQEFIVLRMADFAERLQVEQVSLLLGQNYVLTFQERPGDCLAPVRERIRAAAGRIRVGGPDYLAYAIVDAIVDHYFPVLERFSQLLETLEERVLDAEEAAMQSLLELKHDVLALRRHAIPLRDTLSQLHREERPLIHTETRVYLRDCADHAVRIVDGTESLREMTASLLNIYMSAVSVKMNDIMRVLAIIATIFIPLTFVAGVYGMNFKGDKSPLNMPELDWEYGYVMALGLMAIIAVGMIYFFRRKGWLGRKARAFRPGAVLPPTPPRHEDGHR